MFLPFEESIIELQQEGISVEVLLAEEVISSGEYIGLAEAQRGEGLAEPFVKEHLQDCGQTLFVTDYGEVARWLLEEGGYKCYRCSLYPGITRRYPRRVF